MQTVVKVHIPNREDRTKNLEALSRDWGNCLGDDIFIFPEPAIDMLQSKGVVFQVLERIGTFRDLLEMLMGPDRGGELRYGPPASEGQIAAAEAALGFSIHSSLQELYKEFDGLQRVWKGDKLSSFLLLPVSRLREARDSFLSRNAWVAEYPEDIGDWPGANVEEMAGCIIFAMPGDAMDTVWFMTDQVVWGVSRGAVGVWQSDGHEAHESCKSLMEFVCVHDWGDWVSQFSG